MWYEWLIFAVLFVLIPFGVFKAKVLTKPVGQVTKEQERHANLVAFKLIWFYWLCDLFYMSFIIDNLASKFIFGGLIMVIIFFNLSNIFAKNKVSASSFFSRIGMLQDFLVGVALSIYLIYIIPNYDLREIVSVIVAAIYGGLLTLVGVAWTIRQSAIQKHEDELAKAKPLFTFNFFTERNPMISNRKICLVDSNETPKIITEVMQQFKGVASYMEIENSAQSSFTIKRFYFDGTWHSVSANNTVLPNNRLLIQLYREDTVTHPIMEIEDIFQRKYYYDLMFTFLLSPTEALTDPHVTTLAQMTLISEQEVLSRKIKIDEGIANE